MIINTHAYPRAALIGNPSDGYHGKTIAFVFSNFKAEVILYESPELEIIPGKVDQPKFDSIESLVTAISNSGYYGGIRLIKAAIKRFSDYWSLVTDHCSLITDHKKNFTIRYTSNIPLRLGLAGSSAIITATFKALMQFYEVDIPKPILANLVLETETKELGIAAGLQDRVAQVYEHPVCMDFNKAYMEEHGYGDYQLLDAGHLKNLYIAYRTQLSEGTETTHNSLRARYDIGEPAVLQAMQDWSNLSTEFMSTLSKPVSRERTLKLNELINANYDLRASLVPIAEGNTEMIKAARSTGASAKFTGSGGAIIGLYQDEVHYEVLKIRLKKIGVKILKPKIVTSDQ